MKRPYRPQPKLIAKATALLNDPAVRAQLNEHQRIIATMRQAGYNRTQMGQRLGLAPQRIAQIETHLYATAYQANTPQSFHHYERYGPDKRPHQTIIYRDRPIPGNYDCGICSGMRMNRTIDNVKAWLASVE